MSQYKVINRFKETQHDDHIYEANDPYPAPGKKLNVSRAEFLTEKHHKYGVAFLVKNEEAPIQKKAAAKKAPAEAPVAEAETSEA